MGIVGLKMRMKIFCLIAILSLSWIRLNAASDYMELKHELDSLLDVSPTILFERAKYLEVASSQNSDLIGSGLAAYYIGAYYGKMSISNRALSSYFQAADYFQRSNDKRFLGQTYSAIGATYRHLKKYKEAKDYATLAYRNSLDADNKAKAKILNRIGDMHRDLGQLDSAYYFYRLSLSITEASNITSLGDNYNNIGDLFRKQNNYDSSQYYYKLSIFHLQKGENIPETAENYTSLAELNADFGKMDKAKEYISKSISLLESVPPMYELGNAYNTAIEIYRKINDNDSLVKYLSKMLDFERNNAKAQLVKTTSSIEQEHKLNQKDLENSYLKEQNALKDKTNYLLIFIVVLVVIAGLLLWKQIRNKKEENKVLAEQNKIIRESNEKLQIAYHDINELNITKDKFFSIIAHDLKNPLGSFKMMITLMAEAYDDFTEEEIKNFIGMLKESSDNLYSLLENLLDWSRSQRGKIVYSPSNADLYFIVQNTFSLLKSAADNKSINLISHISGNYPLIADTNLLTTIIRNLISNAIKFTPNGGSVQVGVREEDEKGIVIYVKDNGVGMPDDVKDQLFKLDSNKSTRGTADESGTGLGLILCKEFIEKHGGNIWVDSEMYKGTTFSFNIPIVAELEEEEMI